jgi:ABC-2 type transport system permease protein
LCVLFGFAFTWLFITIGLVAGNAQAAQGMSLLVFPLTFASSAYVPVETLPRWLQPFAEHQPITYMVDTVRSLCLGDSGQAVLGHGTGHFLGPALLWSVALVVVFGSTAVALFRRS